MRGERIRESPPLQGDHGRDQCQDIQPIRIFGTDRSRGSGGISPLFSFRSSVREEIPRRRQASFMVKYPLAVGVRLFMTEVSLTIL
jgi:hypothetical protein